MEIKKGKTKSIALLMLWAALLIWLVMHSEVVFGGIGMLINMVQPFIVGAVIAFVLNLPMRKIEKTFFSKSNNKIVQKIKRPMSMLLAIIVVIAIIMVVVFTVVPQITKTGAQLGREIPVFLDNVVITLEQLSQDYPEINEQVMALGSLDLNWESIQTTVINFLKNGASSMLTSTVSVASGIIGGAVNLFISFIFALYILSQKEKLADQGERIITAYCSENVKNRIMQVLSLLHRNFSNFITGQCLEAVILGTMFVVAMSIFGMPYAFMVGVLIAFTALIPIVGAFVGCAVGAFLILIEDPIMAVWFVIMFLIIQQIEGNLIYPRVVGNSVGLPSMWVLVAVSLGGSLFGVAGMLFFIPLVSTIYALIRESVNNRNARKALTSMTVTEVKESQEDSDDIASTIGVEEAVNENATTVQTDCEV